LLPSGGGPSLGAKISGGKGHPQWRSRTFGRLVRWSNLQHYCLRFWKMDILFKASRTNAYKVTCSIYSILVSS